MGFDCRGLALYSVYQGTGGAVSLPMATAQAQYSDASSYGESYISDSSLQPGDLVFFGGSSSDVEHVGIVVSGTGGSAESISAISEHYGIATETIPWFEGEFSWVGAVAIPGVGNTVGGGPPPPVWQSLLAVSDGSGTVTAKARGLSAAWDTETGADQETVAVASDPTNGPLIAAIDPSGTASQCRAPRTTTPDLLRLQALSRRQLLQATPNRVLANPRRTRHRRNPAIPQRLCLARRLQPPLPLVQLRTHPRKTLRNLRFINHAAAIRRRPPASYPPH